MKESWIFTFRYGHKYPNKYVIIDGDFSSARREMVKRYENKWAFQYENTPEKRASLHFHNVMPLENKN